MPRLSYHYVFEEGNDPAAPPLLLLHGTGVNEQDLLRLGHSLSPGSARLSPRGDVSEGGALRFFARLVEGVFDPAEVTRRTHALGDFILTATKQHGLDPGKLIAVGFSNGANIAAPLLQLRPETLGAEILLRSMVVLNQLAAAGSLAGRRVLLLNGVVDPIVPADHPPRLAELLRAGGAEVKLLLIQASHGLTLQDVAAAKAWLQT
ncbi:MAG: alpha/beta hydrolase [Opitutus sp.]|nr:alpha/beta hydrolase [Opitutus sp.]